MFAIYGDYHLDVQGDEVTSMNQSQDVIVLHARPTSCWLRNKH